MATKTCDHCGTTCVRRYAVKRDGAVVMVGSSCAKRFPRAKASDLIRSLNLRQIKSGKRSNEATQQPDWKLLWSTDYSALYADQTGVYEPELMIAQEYEDGRKTEFTVYRFSVDKQKVVQDPYGKKHIVPDRWDRTWPHPIHRYEEWFIKDLDDVARSAGTTRSDLIKRLTSDNPSERASAYEDIGGYHGFDNFDSYPQTWSEEKMEKDWP